MRVCSGYISETVMEQVSRIMAQRATMKHKIEIFSAGCSICKQAIEMVRAIAGPEHEVHVLDMHQSEVAKRAKQQDIRSLPAMMVDGRLTGCCAERGPDEHVLRADLA